MVLYIADNCLTEVGAELIIDSLGLLRVLSLQNNLIAEGARDRLVRKFVRKGHLEI